MHSGTHISAIKKFEVLTILLGIGVKPGVDLGSMPHVIESNQLGKKTKKWKEWDISKENHLDVCHSTKNIKLGNQVGWNSAATKKARYFAD